MKSPCGAYLRDHLVYIFTWKGCPELQFDGKRHWCSLVLSSTGPERGKLEDELAIDAGCCSTFNSWRYEEIVDRRAK